MAGRTGIARASRRLAIATAVAGVTAAAFSGSALASLDAGLAPLTSGSSGSSGSSGLLAPVTQTVSDVTQTATAAAAPQMQTATQSPAPAQTSPGSVGASPAVAPVTQAVSVPAQEVTQATAPVTKAVTSVAQTATTTAEPVAKSTAPVAQTVSNVATPVVETVTPATAAVSEGLAPAAGTLGAAPSLITEDVRNTVVTATQALEPVTQSAVGAAGPLLAPVVQAGGPGTGPVDSLVAPIVSDVTGTLPPTRGTRSPETDGAPVAGTGASPVPVYVPDGSSVPLTVVTTRGRPPLSSMPPTRTTVGETRGTAPVARPDRGVRAAGDAFGQLPPDPVRAASGGAPRPAGNGSTRAPTAPTPDLPGAPAGSSSAGSGSPGGGFSPILLAALAAALILAAPRLGRRLRPGMAPWPLPTLALSLERPG